MYFPVAFNTTFAIARTSKDITDYKKQQHQHHPRQWKQHFYVCWHSLCNKRRGSETSSSSCNIINGEPYDLSQPKHKGPTKSPVYFTGAAENTGKIETSGNELREAKQKVKRRGGGTESATNLDLACLRNATLCSNILYDLRKIKRAGASHTVSGPKGFGLRMRMQGPYYPWQVIWAGGSII